MKMLFRGINKTALIVTLIAVIPFTLYVYQNYRFKQLQLQNAINEKQLTQEAYDECLRLAYVEYRTEYRNMCWRYNHDATECDLSYMKVTGIVKELPNEKLVNDVKECDSKYPVNQRLYAKASPDAEILEYGKISEREAFKKVMQTEEYKDFTRPPMEEGYSITFEVQSPTEDNAYWIFRLYKYSNTDEKTFATFKVDADDGTLSKI